MANLEAVCGDVEKYLEVRGVRGLTHGAVMIVLRSVEQNEPWFFDDCRVGQAVHAKLKIAGAVDVPKVEVTNVMLNRLEQLGEKDPKMRAELAEIILWSDTFTDAEEKCGAFGYGTDAYQTLLPAFRVLYNQPEVRARVIQSLQERIGDQATADIIDEYLLQRGNQPYGVFPNRHPEIPPTTARSMMYLVMGVMLETMKKHLMA